MEWVGLVNGAGERCSPDSEWSAWLRTKVFDLNTSGLGVDSRHIGQVEISLGNVFNPHYRRSQKNQFVSGDLRKDMERGLTFNSAVFPITSGNPATRGTWGTDWKLDRQMLAALK
jgi:hypothetical protein